MNILRVVPKTPALLAALHTLKHGDHDQSDHAGGTTVGGLRTMGERIDARADKLAEAVDEAWASDQIDRDTNLHVNARIEQAQGAVERAGAELDDAERAENAGNADEAQRFIDEGRAALDDAFFAIEDGEEALKIAIAEFREGQ